jgi:hypothetical protein
MFTWGLKLCAFTQSLRVCTMLVSICSSGRALPSKCQAMNSNPNTVKKRKQKNEEISHNCLARYQ